MAAPRATLARPESAVVSTAGVEQPQHIAVRDAKVHLELVHRVRPEGRPLRLLIHLPTHLEHRVLTILAVAVSVMSVQEGNAAVSMVGVEQAQPIVGRDAKAHSEFAVDRVFIKF